MILGKGIDLTPGPDFGNRVSEVLEERDPERIISFGAYIGVFVARNINTEHATVRADIIRVVAQRFADEVQPPLNKDEQENFTAGVTAGTELYRQFDHRLVTA